MSAEQFKDCKMTMKQIKQTTEYKDFKLKGKSKLKKQELCEKLYEFYSNTEETQEEMNTSLHIDIEDVPCPKEEFKQKSKSEKKEFSFCDVTEEEVREMKVTKLKKTLFWKNLPKKVKTLFNKKQITIEELAKLVGQEFISAKKIMEDKEKREKFGDGPIPQNLSESPLPDF
jgi:hypothetical protein